MGDIIDNPGREARLLIRRQGTAALGTLADVSDNPVHRSPYTSLVLTAADYDGTPLLLISTLAVHTQNIAVDNRVSLLFSDVGPGPYAGAGSDDPLAQSRVTLMGRARPTKIDRHRDRFLRRHASADGYADFADFGFYRVDVERAHLVAGFGQITWIDGPDVILNADISQSIAAAEPGIIDHMNADHSDAVSNYATLLLAQDSGNWRVLACDPDGLDLVETTRGDVVRLDFDQPATTPAEFRAVLVNLAKIAKTPAKQR